MTSLIAGLIYIAGVFLLSFLLLVPVLLYLLGAFRPQHRYVLKNLPDPASKNFGFTLASLSDSFMTNGRITHFWVGAADIYQARWDAIARARHTILFETFYMTPGRRANEFAEVLIERAQSGVQIKLIADSYGVHSLPRAYWERLRQAGIDIGFFNRFHWRSPLDYLDRTHRKLLIVDHKIALIGGAGISDMWDTIPDEEEDVEWFDFEIQLEGQVVSVLRGIFLQHWLDTHGCVDFRDRNLIVGSGQADARIIVTPGEDPTYRDSSIRSLLQVAIMAARRRIWIASPYFLPDLNTRIEMGAAKQRGVDIRVLTMGDRTDKPFVHHTCRMLYRDIINSGVEIYEYQPSMLHSKVILIDDAWVTIGSANFDPRSFFRNDELNLSTAEETIFKQIEAFFKLGFSASKEVTLRDLRKRSLRERLTGRIGLLAYWQL